MRPSRGAAYLAFVIAWAAIVFITLENTQSLRTWAAILMLIAMIAISIATLAIAARWLRDKE